MLSSEIPIDLQYYSIYKFAEKILENIISYEIQNGMVFVNGCVRYM